jgi:hypothetical protein
MFATWTFISIGRRVTQEWKFAFRLCCDSILLFKGRKKTLEIYDFQSSESYQGDIHSSSFFLFSTLQSQSACGNAEATDCNKAALWRHVQL